MKVLLAAALVATATRAAIPLAQPLTYFKLPAVRALTPLQAQKLYDVPVVFGDGGDGPVYVKDGRPNRTAGTCRAFEQAQRDGYEPQANVDIVMSGFLVRACGLLDALVRARPARRSTIDRPRVGVRDIDQISSSVLPGAPWDPARLSPAEQRRRERTSIAAFVHANRCRVTVATAVELQFRCDDMLYALTELVRADVGVDGTESLVVAPYIRSMTGTFAYPAPVEALTRTSAHGLLLPSTITPRFAARDSG